MEQAGVTLQEESKADYPATHEVEEPVAAQSSKDELKGMTLDELNTLLNEVLDQEDYMRAIAIRDEIKRRS